MNSEIDRGFVRIAEGQVHYRAIGDFRGRARPLVMLHSSPISAFTLQPLMHALAEVDAERPLYAPDTLGNGDSCKARMPVPDIAYYADAVRRQLDAFGIDEVDVFGGHTGGAIATELAIGNPKRVRRVVIDGIGLYSQDTIADMLANYTPEVVPDPFGGQFNWAWHFMRDQQLFFPWYKRDAAHQRTNGLPDSDHMHDMVVEFLKSARTYHHGYRASFRYPKRERLPLITQPTLVIFEASDPLLPYKEETMSLVKNGTDGVLPEAASLRDKAAMIQDWLSKTA